MDLHERVHGSLMLHQLFSEPNHCVDELRKLQVRIMRPLILVRYGGKNVNFVVVVVVISVCVFTVTSRASCCFQADAFKQVVESLSDG